MTAGSGTRSEDTEPPVHFTLSNGVATLTLCRPENRNAFSPETFATLMDGLDRAEADSSCGALLLTGFGPAFCAGQDLTQRGPRKIPFPPDLASTVDQFYNPLIRRLRSLSRPVVCAVNGVAAGAGVGIALACDITIAAEDADFVLAFTRIGLVPDAGTTWFLTRRLGEAKARALALTGARISGAEAAELGLIWKAVPSDTLADEAQRLAHRLSEGPREALNLTRQAIRAALENTLDTQLDLERDLQGQAGRNPDYAEGVLAFLEKRQPVFGRSHRGDDDTEE